MYHDHELGFFLADQDEERFVIHKEKHILSLKHIKFWI